VITVASVELAGYAVGYEHPVPLPGDIELLGITQPAPGRPLLAYTTTGGQSYAPKVILIIGEYNALPDRNLRWLGSFTTPGYYAPTHVFEVLA
jgi:hypothetical protein